MSLIRSAQRKKLLLIAGVCLVGTSCVYAEEDDFDLGAVFDLKVTTASKRPERIESAPGVITSISRYEIEKMGAKNLTDILAQVPGLQMYNSEAFDVNKASLRGDVFSYLDNHTLLLVNGRPIREGVYQGFNTPVYKLFPINIIERIEVVRGPGSVLYGSTAMSGVINIITQKITTKTGVMVGGSNEKDIYESTNIALTSANGESGIIIANQFHNNAGRERTIKSRDLFGNDIEITKKMQTADIGLFGQMYHKNLTVSSFFGRTEYATLGWLHPIQLADNNMQARLFLNLDYKTKLNDTWQILTSGTWNKIDIKLFDEGRKPNSPLFPTEIPDGQEEKFGQENSSDFLLESYVSGTIIENLNVLAGGLISNDNKWKIPDTRPFSRINVDADGNIIVEEDRTSTAVSKRYHSMFYSGYGQIDYRFLDRFKVIAGFQANKPETGDVDVVPRFGTIVDIIDGLGVKVLYGHAYRSPNQPEKAGGFTDIFGVTKKLVPEKIKTIDAQIIYSKDKISASATYFYSRMSNFIQLAQFGPTTLGAGFYNISDEIKSSGVELETKISPLTGLMVTGSWLGQNTNKTYTPKDSANEITDYNVAQSPNNILKFGISYSAPFKLTSGVYLEHYAHTSLYNNGILPSVKDPKSSTILNANIGYTLPFKHDFTLNVGIKNILDDDAKQAHILSEKIQTDYAQREPGRTVQFSISSSF